MVGKDELLSEALSILTECALPPRTETQVLCAECGSKIPDTVRKGAKYCTPQCSSKFRDRQCRLRGKGFDAKPAPAPPKTHIGSMWTWPEDQMFAYAVRQVGFQLLNYTRLGHLETPASQTLYNLALAGEIDEDAREIAEAWLEANGIHCTGDETIEDLIEAVSHLKEIAA
jgi:hypothetical protein